MHTWANSESNYIFHARSTTAMNHPRPNSSFAAATTRSGSKPNFLWSSLSGAEAPKVFMPMMWPEAPTYRSHPKVEACSTATRAVTLGGSTLSPVLLGLVVEDVPGRESASSNTSSFRGSLQMGSV